MKQPYDTLKYPHQPNIIDNFRRLYKDTYHEECTLPDRDIWEAYEEWYGVSDEENRDKTSDDLTIEFLYECMHP